MNHEGLKEFQLKLLQRISKFISNKDINIANKTILVLDLQKSCTFSDSELQDFCNEFIDDNFSEASFSIGED